MVLAIWVAAWIVGIALGLLLPPWLVVPLAVLVGPWAGWQVVHRRWVVSVGAGLLVAGVLAARVAQSPDSVSTALRRAAASNQPVQIVARVIRGVRLDLPRTESGGGKVADRRMHAVVAAEMIDGIAAQGELSLSAPATNDLAPGDVISFSGRVRLPTGLANPELPDERLLARAHGIDGFVALGPTGAMHRMSTGSRWNLRRLAFAARTLLGEIIGRHVYGAPESFLRGVVLGERSAVGVEVEEGFRAAGVTHILSVSGLHLATVAALLYFLVGRVLWCFPRLALLRWSAAIPAILSGPCIVFYTLLTGEAVATVRSALMALVALGAIAIRRPFSFAACIGAAALVITMDSPLAVLDVSFQLSFMTVMALGACGGAVARLARGGESSTHLRRLGGRLAHWLLASLVASTIAALASAPLVAHHFGEVVPAAPLGNLILVPLVELWVVPLGLLGAGLGAPLPSVGGALLALAGWGASLAMAVAEFFRRFDMVCLVPSPGIGTTALLTAGVAACIVAANNPPPHRRHWLVIAGVLTALAASVLVTQQIRRHFRNDVAVTFVDVGQGDAALIEGPGGFAALIDGGGSYDGGFDPGARVVEPILRRRGITRLDLVALSHPHPDHMGGLPRILARFPVAQLWTSGDDGHNPEYHRLLALARRRGVALRVPTTMHAGGPEGGVLIEPLGPWVGDRIAPPDGVSVNDASLVLAVRYANRTVMLTGDVEADGEGELVARAAAGMRAACDVLKVPHHGSRTSSSAEFLDAVQPSLAVMSLGFANRFGFPRSEVLTRYAERGIRVLRTDLHGAVTVTIEKSGAWHATCARGCR